MKKQTIKKILTGMICLAVSATAALSGCGGVSEGEEIDPSKFQLRVANYNGGIGSEWLEAAIERFETVHATDTFPGDKTGIQIIATKDKTHYSTTISQQNFDIIIDQDVNYIDLASSGALLDITDVVTDTSGGTSIESRMTDRQKSALTAISNKYYVVPHYEYFGGISYDINVFEDKLLYLAKDKDNDNNGFIENLADEKSLGPDGKTGKIDGIDYSLDDGLPATYDEFYKLLDQMVASGVIPFVWTGQYKYYANGLLFGLLASYCGADELSTCVTFDSGENGVRIVEGFDGDEPQITTATVTKETGYYTKQLAGEYYALKFMEKVLSNSNYYHSSSKLTSFTNTNAQKIFVDGWCRQAPVGFLIDGNFWYNEAKEAKHLEGLKKLGYTEEERHFGWMPLPGVVSDNTEDKSTTPTLMNQADSFIMINSKIKDDATKVRVAKEFVKFLNTEQSLQEFTVTTGVTKALKYDLTDSQIASMNTFYQSVWNMKKNADIVYMMDGNSLYVNNQSSFVAINGGSFWQTTVGGSTTNLITDKIFGGATAKDCFLGMNKTSDWWSNNYSKFFN